MRILLSTVLLGTMLGRAADAPAISESLKNFSAARNAGLPALAIDLTQAVLVAAENLSVPERSAVTLLAEEVEKRTLVP